MAITTIEIIQDNKYNGSDLLPVHCQLVFLVNVVYTDTAPDYILVALEYGGASPEVYKCIPIQDIETGLRQFAFFASEPIRALMGNFDDFLQTNGSFLPVPDITKIIELTFYDPEDDETNDVMTATFIHATAQFSERANLHKQFNNEMDTYYCLKGGICYIYFYNNDSNNAIEINDGVPEIEVDPQLIECGNEFIGGTYVNYSFDITGLGLSNSVTITASEHFKITLDEVTILDEIVLTPVNGVINETIFVAFMPVDEVAYNEVISIESLDFTTINVSVTGAGDPLPS